MERFNVSADVTRPPCVSSVKTSGHINANDSAAKARGHFNANEAAANDPALKNPAAKRFATDCSGASGAGALLAFAAVFIVFVCIGEFIYAFNIKQKLDIELTRAVNTAVDLSMSDLHRQDKISELDEEIAFGSFYDYLYDDMNLSNKLEARSPGGKILYALDIKSLVISKSPPGIYVSGEAAVTPLFFGPIPSGQIRIPIRGNSVNRRMD